MAEDIMVLEQYLIHQGPEAQSASKPYSTVQTSSGNPMVYLTVPRKRKGLRSPLDPGRTQREIIEQVLNPFTANVRKLYFDYVHPCFPILDEHTFAEMWEKDNDCISSTLVCDMYALASLYWKKCETLRRHPRPDLNFLWNHAVPALQDDFMGPTMSTIPAALLDMVGRPVGAVTGNIVNVGRVVTLAQSLGLHRDPTSWKTSAHEKNVRIRLWWGVLIHDTWSSIGHGIPPAVNSKYSDVPMVTSDMLLASLVSEAYTRTTTAFIKLCRLTRILGDLLPCVYSLTLDLEDMWRHLRKTDCALDEWVVALPTYLRSPRTSGELGVNGSSNLWFAYLSVKLLMCRLAFKATLKEGVRSSEARQYRFAELRRASCDVVDFVISLCDDQLQEFWLPYTSYLLVTATTILLRCTIESGDSTTNRWCIVKLVNFYDRLRKAKDDCDWDLAEFCLERCSEPIQKIANALNSARISPGEDAEATTTKVPVEAAQDVRIDEDIIDLTKLSDIFLPVDQLDLSWDSLWDSFDSSWPQPIE